MSDFLKLHLFPFLPILLYLGLLLGWQAATLFRQPPEAPLFFQYVYCSWARLCSCISGHFPRDTDRPRRRDEFSRRFLPHRLCYWHYSSQFNFYYIFPEVTVLVIILLTCLFTTPKASTRCGSSRLRPVERSTKLPKNIADDITGILLRKSST